MPTTQTCLLYNMLSVPSIYGTQSTRRTHGYDMEVRATALYKTKK